MKRQNSYDINVVWESDAFLNSTILLLFTFRALLNNDLKYMDEISKKIKEKVFLFIIIMFFDWRLLCFPRNFSCFSLCTLLSNHIRRHLLLASFCNVDYFQAENLMNFREMTFIVESLTRLSTSRPSFEDRTGSFMYFCVCICICICRCTCIAKLQKIVYCINGKTFHDFYFVH